MQYDITTKHQLLKFKFHWIFQFHSWHYGCKLVMELENDECFSYRICVFCGETCHQTITTVSVKLIHFLGGGVKNEGERVWWPAFSQPLDRKLSVRRGMLRVRTFFCYPSTRKYLFWITFCIILRYKTPHRSHRHNEEQIKWLWMLYVW